MIPGDRARSNGQPFRVALLGLFSSPRPIQPARRCGGTARIFRLGNVVAAISSLAHGLIAEMSVGLNAVAVQKPSDR